MATGRTLNRWLRFYADGYDLSGYTRSVGPLAWEFETDPMKCLGDAINGGLPNHATIEIGTLNGVFDNTADTGLHAIASSSSARNIMIPWGIRAAPAAGDPVFVGKFQQLGYQASPEINVYATIPWTRDVTSDMSYTKPWGTLLHAKGNETEANSDEGIDDHGAATTAGGYLMYQIFSATGAAGTATISIDDSANNSDFLALSGATSGAIAVASIPTGGIVQLGTTATVRRYLRWQISLDTLTAVHFALAFIRG